MVVAVVVELFGDVAAAADDVDAAVAVAVIVVRPFAFCDSDRAAVETVAVVAFLRLLPARDASLSHCSGN